MSIDNALHSLFGVSKTAADLMVQEYGKYFGLKTCAWPITRDSVGRKKL
jgi:CDP-paratose 2-epimerase